MNYLSSLKRLSQQRKEVKDGLFDVYNTNYNYWRTGALIYCVRIMNYMGKKNI